MIYSAISKKINSKAIAKALGITFVKQIMLWVIEEIPKFIATVGGNNATDDAIANFVFRSCPYWKGSKPPRARTIRRYLLACQKLGLIVREYTRLDGKYYLCTKRTITSFFSKVSNAYKRAVRMFSGRDITKEYIIDEPLRMEDGRVIPLYKPIPKWQIISTVPNLVYGNIAV